MESPKPQYVYILKCADGTLYTGWTTDLEARVATHNAGKGAKTPSRAARSSSSTTRNTATRERRWPGNAPSKNSPVPRRKS